MCCLLQLQQRENSRTVNRTHVTEQFHYVQYNISIKRYIRTLYFNVNAFYIYSIDLQILSSDYNAPLCSMQHVKVMVPALPGEASVVAPALSCVWLYRHTCSTVLYIFFIYCIMHYLILSIALYNGLTHLLKAFKFDLPSKIHPIFPTHQIETSAASKSGRI